MFSKGVVPIIVTKWLENRWVGSLLGSHKTFKDLDNIVVTYFIFNGLLHFIAFEFRINRQINQANSINHPHQQLYFLQLHPFANAMVNQNFQIHQKTDYSGLY